MLCSQPRAALPRWNELIDGNGRVVQKLQETLHTGSMTSCLPRNVRCLYCYGCYFLTTVVDRQAWSSGLGSKVPQKQPTSEIKCLPSQKVAV